jgi:hypothetical protein
MESFQERFISVVEPRIAKADCPLCHTNDWSVQPGVYYLRQHVKTESGESWGYNLPSAALVCKSCGNTQFINLLVYGNIFKEYL